jgi:hypothetical protein
LYDLDNEARGASSGSGRDDLTLSVEQIDARMEYLKRRKWCAQSDGVRRLDAPVEETRRAAQRVDN